MSAAAGYNLDPLPPPSPFLLSKQIDKSCGGGSWKGQDCCKMLPCADILLG